MHRGAEATLQVSQPHKQLTNSNLSHETSNAQSSTPSPEAIKDGKRGTLTDVERGSFVVNHLNHSKTKSTNYAQSFTPSPEAIEDGGRRALKDAEHGSVVVNDLNHSRVKNANYTSKLEQVIHEVEEEDVEEDPTLDEYHNMKRERRKTMTVQRNLQKKVRELTTLLICQLTWN